MSEPAAIHAPVTLTSSAVVTVAVPEAMDPDTMPRPPADVMVFISVMVRAFVERTVMSPLVTVVTWPSMVAAPDVVIVMLPAVAVHVSVAIMLTSPVATIAIAAVVIVLALTNIFPVDVRDRSPDKTT